MNDALSRKLAEILGKMDEKVLQAKLNAALDMLKKGNTDELAKKINKMDKGDLLKQLNEFDESRIKELNIDKNELKQRIQNTDLEKLGKLLGEHGDDMIKKIKDIIK